MKTKYKTGYTPIYRDWDANGRLTFDCPYNDNYEVAAIKTIYRGYKINSRDAFVENGMWVDGNEINAFAKAIELRKQHHS